MVLVDIDNENLYNIFYTRNRPLAWQYLNVTLSDLDSGEDIVVHKSESNLFSYVKYVQIYLAVCASLYRWISSISLLLLESLCFLFSGDCPAAKYGTHAFSSLLQCYA